MANDPVERESWLAAQGGLMLLNGFNHVAILTRDTQRFVDFYRDVFEAEVDGFQDMGDEGRLTFVRVGAQAEARAAPAPCRSRTRRRPRSRRRFASRSS